MGTLKQVCHWIEQKKPTSAELNKYQHKVQDQALDDKINFCKPRWIEGFCPRHKDKAKFEQCTLPDGKWCKHGRVFPGTEDDDTAKWSEPFPEKKVTVDKGFMPLILVPPMPRELSRASQRRHDGARFL